MVHSTVLTKGIVSLACCGAVNARSRPAQQGVPQALVSGHHKPDRPANGATGGRTLILFGIAFGSRLPRVCLIREVSGGVLKAGMPGEGQELADALFSARTTQNSRTALGEPARTPRMAN
jgi:hypothetical protein